MTTLGTALTPSATKVMLCGSGELGKELTISLQRLGVEVIALDHYDNAPAMQVAHRSYVIDMLDPKALHEIAAIEQPHLIVPEVEAIATDALLELEQMGFKVVPCANAVHLTMNREAIRNFAQSLNLKTTSFIFADNQQDYKRAVKAIGLPCVVKPTMSSSGKGQSIVRTLEDIEAAWECSQTMGRTKHGKVMVEAFCDFDYEVTLLTVSHGDKITTCEPIGHNQVDGDYRLSWQPHRCSKLVTEQLQHMAKSIVSGLGGHGIFGVEFFVKGDEVYFNEVSPRPHDTGMVTLVSQNLSEFDLHARAILGLPIPTITVKPSASHALVFEGKSENISFKGIERALEQPDTDVRLFAKPIIAGKRRLGVALANAADTEQAIEKVQSIAKSITVTL